MSNFDNPLTDEDQQFKQNYDKFIEELSILQFKSYGPTTSNIQQIKDFNINLITDCIIENFFKGSQGNKELRTAVTKISQDVEKELTVKLAGKHNKFEKQLKIKQVFWKICAIASAIGAIVSLGATAICAAAVFRVDFAVESIYRLCKLSTSVLSSINPKLKNYDSLYFADLIDGRQKIEMGLLDYCKVSNGKLEYRGFTDNDLRNNGIGGGLILGPISAVALAISTTVYNFTSKWSTQAQENLAAHQKGEYISKISSKSNNQNILELSPEEIKNKVAQIFPETHENSQLQAICQKINKQISSPINKQHKI